MLRMLVSGDSLDNYQIALVNSRDKYSTLEEYYLVSPRYQERQGNLYKGRISSISPGIEAAFVDIGVGDKHGFLPFNEVDRELLGAGGTSPEKFLKEGQELIVMLKRDAYDDKGPLLTTFPEYEGHYFLLRRERAGDRQPGGNLISRDIQKRSDRERVQELRSFMDEFELPKGYQLIMRTAGLTQKEQGLERDIDQLLDCYDDNQKQLQDNDRAAPALLYTQKDSMRDAIRMHANSVREICTDSDDLYYELRQQIRKLAPWVESKLIQYSSDDSISLFERYHVDSLVVSLFDRMVKLPGGGNIVLEQTEALLSVDVNSSRSKHSSMDKTALATNLEAADEIARQLRLRDLGGQVVIDFIDMNSDADRKKVEERMHEALARDYQDRSVSLQEGRISQEFGLYEMSRKRVRPSLMQKLGIRCPECGQGWMLPEMAMPSRILDAVRDKGNSGEHRDQTVMINISARLARMLRRVYADELSALAEQYQFGIVVKSTLASDNDIQVYCKDRKPEKPLEFNIQAPALAPTKAAVKRTGGSLGRRLFGGSAAKPPSRRRPTKARRKKPSLLARIFGKSASSSQQSNRGKQTQRGGADKKQGQQRRGGGGQQKRRQSGERGGKRNNERGGGRDGEKRQGGKQSQRGGRRRGGRGRGGQNRGADNRGSNNAERTQQQSDGRQEAREPRTQESQTQTGNRESAEQNTQSRERPQQQQSDGRQENREQQAQPSREHAEQQVQSRERSQQQPAPQSHAPDTSRDAGQNANRHVDRDASRENHAPRTQESRVQPSQENAGEQSQSQERPQQQPDQQPTRALNDPRNRG